MLLPKEEAIKSIKQYIKKTYGKKGEEIVKKNYKAVDETFLILNEVEVPNKATSNIASKAAVPAEAPDFVKNVTGTIIAGHGDDFPVSAFSVDGTCPTGTTQWEKRNIASEIPVWDPDICIQCNKCAFVCPHGVIRPKVYYEEVLEKAPETFKSTKVKGRDWEDGEVYTLASCS